MKKTQLTVLLFLITSSLTFSQNVGIGLTNPDASALLDLNPPNNDKGLLLPRLTEQERDGISNPAESLWIFNTDSQCYEGYSTQKSQWFPVGCLEEPATPPFVCEGEFTDSRDNNTYKTAQIGNQCWMAENLKYLPLGSSISAKGTESATVSHYYIYDSDATSDLDVAKNLPHYKTYGVLYNWPAVMQGLTGSDANPSGVKGICPTGWHVPSDAEWCEMENYIDPVIKCGTDAITGHRGTLAGTQLKAQNGWNNSGNGSDFYGFTALPGGGRYKTNLGFNNMGSSGLWWSASESGATAFYRNLSQNNAGVNRNANGKVYGFSLRCVQD